MLHPFFIRAHEETVDVADWYRTVVLAASQRSEKNR